MGEVNAEFSHRSFGRGLYTKTIQSGSVRFRGSPVQTNNDTRDDQYIFTKDDQLSCRVENSCRHWCSLVYSNPIQVTAVLALSQWQPTDIIKSIPHYKPSKHVFLPTPRRPGL